MPTPTPSSMPGDVVAISGRARCWSRSVEPVVPEVDDRALLDMPATQVDVFVRSKAFNGKTLRELADQPFARGVYLGKITRSMVEIPILPETEILRGDILTIAGQHAPRRRGRQGAGPTPIGRSRPPTSDRRGAASWSAA